MKNYEINSGIQLINSCLRRIHEFGFASTWLMLLSGRLANSTSQLQIFCVKKICIKFELEYIPFRVFYCECRSNREYKRRCPHFTAKNGGSVGTFFYLEN